MKFMRMTEQRACALNTNLKLWTAAVCAFSGLAVSAQQITVRGLPAAAEGEIFAEVLVDEPVESVRMSIPGVLDRIERFAPYALASDSNGQLNPFDTTDVADGDYVLTVAATLSNGQTVSRNFPFAINNEPDPAPAAAPSVRVTVAGLPQTVRGTVFPEIRVSQPVRSVRMTIDGIVERIERSAPYALFSDTNGRINPFDTTQFADGDYVLNISIDLVDGKRASANYAFTIDNVTDAVSKPVILDIPSAPRPEAPAPQTPEVPETPEAPATDAAAPEASTPETPEAETPAAEAPAPQAPAESDDAAAPQPTAGPNDPPAVPVPVPAAPVATAPVPAAPQPTAPLAPELADAPVVQETPGLTEAPSAEDTPEPAEAPEPVAAPIEIELRGLSRGATVNGDIRVEAVVDQPVESVSFSIPGVLERTERSAPYALASDTNGRLNPLNTRELDNGDYTLTVVATAADGRRATSRFSFSVNNVVAPPPAAPEAPAAPQADATAPQTPSANGGNAADPTPPAATPETPVAETTTPEAPAPQAPAPEPVAEAEPTTPEPAPTPPTPITASGDGPALQPGNGADWVNAPGRVGNVNAPGGDRIALARWDVVPEQTFAGEFPIGVVAHHLFGIDYVEFQVEGGTPVRVEQSSINPRTSVDEYWVVLDADDFSDRRIEVRAVAYPHNGVPRVLPPLFLFANEGGTIQHPVLELPAGRHTLNSRDIPEQGWLIVRPAPGVSREQCIIVGRTRGWRSGNLKLENLTHETGNVNGTVLGDFSRDSQPEQLWMDNVRVVGLENGNTAGWVAQAWTHQYYTDCTFTRVDRVFQHGPITARNIEAVEIYEDFANANGLLVNMTVDRLDRLNDTSNHPDLFQYARNVPNNLIIQDITSTRNNGQGLFTDDMEDVAVVRLEVTTVSPFRAIQLQGRTENVLIEDSRFNGSGNFRLDQGFSADDFIFRDSRSAGGPLFLPANFNTPGVTVLPPPAIFD